MDDEKKYLLEIMKSKQTSIDVNEVDVRDFAVQAFRWKIYVNEIFHFI